MRSYFSNILFARDELLNEIKFFIGNAYYVQFIANSVQSCVFNDIELFSTFYTA